MLEAPRGDYRAIAQELSRRLNQTVFVADLSAEGWEFKGAAICPVGGRGSAHLLYARDGQTLSLFTLAPEGRGDCGKLRPGECLRREVQRHPVVLAQRETVLVGLVGEAENGRLTVDHLEGLYQRHKDGVVAGAGSAVARALAARR